MANNKARTTGEAPRARPQGSSSRGKDGSGADVVEIRERLARLEGVMQNVATKADLAELRSEMKTDMAEARVSTIKWFVGTAISLASAMLVITRFFPGAG